MESTGVGWYFSESTWIWIDFYWAWKCFTLQKIPKFFATAKSEFIFCLCDPSNLVVKIIPSKLFSAFEHSMFGMGRKTPSTLYLPNPLLPRPKKVDTARALLFLVWKFWKRCVIHFKVGPSASQSLRIFSEDSPSPWRFDMSLLWAFWTWHSPTWRRWFDLTSPKKWGGWKKSDGFKLHQWTQNRSFTADDG